MAKSRQAEGTDAAPSAGAHGTARRVCLPRPAPGMFELVVLEGPDLGKRVRVDPASAACVLVGSSPLCTLRLQDPGVAPRQCSLQVDSGRLHVLDLASSSTRVNGVLTREAYLSGGEVIRIGESVLCVHRTEDRSAVVRKMTSFGRFHGESDAMRELYPTIARLLHSSTPILVQGEAGSGKRLVSEEIHRHALTDRAPFIAYDEREAAPEAAAAALFGADGRGGLVQRARGGTLYIKEVADLDPGAQKKLAAMIPELATDAPARRVRVVLATRKSPATAALVPELIALVGASRLDLPPLRERIGDVVILARAIWSELGGKGSIPDDFAAQFADHAWPGNVRELRFAVEDRIRHGSTADGDRTKVPPRGQDAMTVVLESNLPFVEARNAVLAAFEKRYVDRALARSGRNVSRAAAASGIAHRYFQVLRSRYRTT